MSAFNILTITDKITRPIRYGTWADSWRGS